MYIYYQTLPFHLSERITIKSILLQGKISADDIKRMAKDLGENFTDAEIREMVEEADRDRKLLPTS